MHVEKEMTRLNQYDKSIIHHYIISTKVVKTRLSVNIFDFDSVVLPYYYANVNRTRPFDYRYPC